MSSLLALVCLVSLSVFLPLLVYGCIHVYIDIGPNWAGGEPSAFPPCSLVRRLRYLSIYTVQFPSCSLVRRFGLLLCIQYGFLPAHSRLFCWQVMVMSSSSSTGLTPRNTVMSETSRLPHGFVRPHAPMPLKATSDYGLGPSRPTSCPRPCTGYKARQGCFRYSRRSFGRQGPRAQCSTGTSWSAWPLVSPPGR